MNDVPVVESANNVPACFRLSRHDLERLKEIARRQSESTGTKRTWSDVVRRLVRHYLTNKER